MLLRPLDTWWTEEFTMVSFLFPQAPQSYKHSCTHILLKNSEWGAWRKDWDSVVSKLTLMSNDLGRRAVSFQDCFNFYKSIEWGGPFYFRWWGPKPHEEESKKDGKINQCGYDQTIQWRGKEHHQKISLIPLSCSIFMKKCIGQENLQALCWKFSNNRDVSILEI